jgi:DNA repair photolyase
VDNPGHADPPPPRQRGRGAASNQGGRYENESRSAFDDGWDSAADPPPVQTTVTLERPKTVITRNQSPDVPFDRSINPYRGCEHGCVYCFARPTHAYMGLSPGLDFETRLFAKPEAHSLLAAELAAKSYKVRHIAIGTNTDPYQPIEREHRIMRGVLEVLRDFRHPVTILTKNALIVRDIDILAEMAAQNLVHTAISITTLDHRLHRTMEPRASAPKARLNAVAKLAEAGVPVGVMTAPIIPAINDHEIEALLEASAEAGANYAGFVVLRLPLELKDLFREWLRESYPDRAARVMRYVREIHGGKDYDSQWGARQRGGGVYAGLIRRRFQAAAKRLGLDRKAAPLRTDLFIRPPQAGDQLSFLEDL